MNAPARAPAVAADNSRAGHRVARLGRRVTGWTPPPSSTASGPKLARPASF